MSSALEPVEGLTEVLTAQRFEVAGPGRAEKPSVPVIAVGGHPAVVVVAAAAAESAASPTSVAAAAVAVVVEEASVVHHAQRPELQMPLGRVAIAAGLAAALVVEAS